MVRGELARREITAKLAAIADTGPSREKIHTVVKDENLKEIGSRLGLEVNLFLTGAGGEWGAPLVTRSVPCRGLPCSS